jgi:tetratricopeptide (TPR) repeat protein
MLLGLGAALYARGSYDEASRHFFEATDLNPADSGPYLFLGRVLEGPEVAQLDGYVERLQRFAGQQPDSALANYYYAIAVWRSWRGPEDRQTAAQVRSLLARAVRIDPTLADAWYQLGIVYSSLSEFHDAIAAYQEAIRTGTQHDESHYRLGQAYQRIGESVKARSEFALYDRLHKTAAVEEEQERNQIQQFVFTLRQ